MHLPCACVYVCMSYPFLVKGCHYDVGWKRDRDKWRKLVMKMEGNSGELWISHLWVHTASIAGFYLSQAITLTPTWCRTARGGRKKMRREMEVNFGSRTHRFTPYPFGIFLDLTPKLLSQATKRNLEKHLWETLKFFFINQQLFFLRKLTSYM